MIERRAAILRGTETVSPASSLKGNGMASTSIPLRWTYTVPTPLGDTESRIELDDDALRF